MANQSRIILVLVWQMFGESRSHDKDGRYEIISMTLQPGTCIALWSIIVWSMMTLVGLNLFLARSNFVSKAVIKGKLKKCAGNDRSDKRMFTVVQNSILMGLR